jgi:hypothetical protein
MARLVTKWDRQYFPNYRHVPTLQHIKVESEWVYVYCSHNVLSPFTCVGLPDSKIIVGFGLSALDTPQN